jgi:NDP-sugar pyrophosphorylase family protein
MNVMILAAGYGTRLLPHTERRPKPLFPILDTTFLDQAIATAVTIASPKRIVVNAYHLSGMIVDHVTSRDYGVEVIVAVEQEILGTAGGIKNAEQWLSDGPFVVMNADMLFSPDLTEAMERHTQNNALATLLLRTNREPERYSPLMINTTGRVTRFIDACGPDHQPAAEWMFTGVTLIDPAIFPLIPAGRKVDISTEIYSPLVSQGGAIYGVVTDAPWNDVGTIDDYHAAIMNAITAESVTPAAAWADLKGFTATDPVYLENGVIIEEGARIGPKVAIHAGAIIGANARLSHCVILPGSIVPPGAIIDSGVI